MSKFTKGDINKDFFDENPEIAFFSEMIEFRNGNKDASRIMWSIYLSEDPDSRFYKAFRDVKKRRAVIEKEYLKTTDFKWEDYNQYIRLYLEWTLSDSKRSLKTWKDKIRELDIYIGTLEFGQDDERLFKIIEKAKPLWVTMEEIEKKVKAESEGEANTIQGKGNLSITDKRYS